MTDRDLHLATAILEALQMRAEARTAGVSEADTAKGFEALVRQVWPFTREWYYLCDVCGDTGLVTKVCRPGSRCDGISMRLDSPQDRPGKYQRFCVKEPTYEHTYGVACSCAKGDRFRAQRRTQESELAQMAKTSKPTRFGR